MREYKVTLDRVPYTKIVLANQVGIEGPWVVFRNQFTEIIALYSKEFVVRVELA